MSVVVARRAIERADVAVVVIDAVEGATDQDGAIAGEVERAGCGVVIAAQQVGPDEGAGARLRQEASTRRSGGS